MENADEISWNGDAEERFTELVVSLNVFKSGLGDRLFEEFLEKVQGVAQNLNLYQERPNSGGDRVIPLAKSGFVLVYRKIGFKDGQGNPKRRLLLMSVRKSY